MDAALVGTAVAGYLGAREGAAAVATASGMGLLRTLKRQALAAGATPEEALATAFGELQPEGLTYLGVAGPQGRIVASAGEPAAALDDLRPRFGPAAPAMLPLSATGRFRVTVPLRRGMGRGWRRGGEGPFVGRRWRSSLLIVEFEPALAHTITSRALTTLVLSLAAAGILLGAAAVFFRLSRRADAIRTQLVEDSQLRVLGQMSAVLGHELRNPLASLKGHAQLLVEKLPEDHRGRRGAERVVHEATRLEALTSQVLDFARTGSLDLEPADPAALARAAIEASEAAPVLLTAPEDVPRWRLDRARLERVLVNLLDNARRASEPEGPVELSLSAIGDRLLIEVADRGEGIEPGDEERIFEPFHTRRAKGTGLGLALARRIVDGHGGTLSADNRPGGGAVFRVELPGGG